MQVIPIGWRELCSQLDVGDQQCLEGVNGQVAARAIIRKGCKITGLEVQSWDNWLLKRLCLHDPIECLNYICWGSFLFFISRMYNTIFSLTTNTWRASKLYRCMGKIRNRGYFCESFGSQLDRPPYWLRRFDVDDGHLWDEMVGRRNHPVEMWWVVGYGQTC